MTTVDYTAKGREVARMAIRGAYDKPTPKPAIEYIRIVGVDPTKMTEAQAKELHDAYREALKIANERSWSAPLFAILQEGGYPTDKQIDDAVRLSGAKTATSGEVHHLCMMLDSELVYGALNKYGVKVIDDGNKYR